MVAPFSGPFTRYEYLYGPPNIYGFKPIWYEMNRTWMRQRKPYDTPLSYQYSNRRVLSHWSWNDVAYTSIAQSPSLDGSSAAFAYNKAYAKFVSSFSEASQWAVTLFEQKQTIALLSKPLSRLLKFSKQVKRGKFRAAAKTLKMALPPKGLKNEAKYYGENWLKYHFGIEPLVKDIFNSVDVLCRDFDPIKVVGSGRDSSSSVVLWNYLYGIPGGTQEDRGAETRTVETKVRIQANIRINNPNLFLASQMGLVNPLSFAWEVIPFSFIVDWFANVGQVLASMTDFAGTEFEKPQHTYFQVATHNLSRTYVNRIWNWHYPPPPAQPTYEVKQDVYPEGYSTRSVFVTRSTGSIPGPTLKLPAFRGLSVTRGVTAVALLVQALK